MPITRPLILSLLLSMACCAGACAAPAPNPESDPITAAIANPARSDRDRGRDTRDRPETVLKLAGFGPGMAIADIFGGGGYYSEILSSLVGPQGRVVLINNPPYDAYAKKALDARLAGGRLANVDYRIVPNAAMNLGEAKLDGAMIIMSYHDLYVADPEQGWPAIDAGQFIDQIVTALKPGGKLLIVDHSARAGTGKSAAQVLHRIDEAFARNDFETHGLELVDSSDVLRHKDDERTLNVTDEAIRGKTDRFVQVYRKP